MEIKSITTYQDIGREIRALRQKRGWTGLQLAKKVNMSQSRISKIETASVQIPLKQAERILNILACPLTIRQRIFTVIELQTNALNSKFRPITSIPNQALRREQHARQIRSFHLNGPPAILQVPAYRAAVLNSWQHVSIPQKMNEYLRRQELLWDKNKSFHFILHEAALYTALAGNEIQCMQLDRLLQMSTMPDIKIGIIPLTSGLLAAEAGNFILYDNSTLLCADANKEWCTTSPEEITEYLKIFQALHKKTVYDNDAREIITKATAWFE